MFALSLTGRAGAEISGDDLILRSPGLRVRAHSSQSIPLPGAPRQGYSLVPQGLLEYRNAISRMVRLALSSRYWHRRARIAVLWRRLAIDVAQRRAIRSIIWLSTRLLGLLGPTDRQSSRVNWSNPPVGSACNVGLRNGECLVGQKAFHRLYTRFVVAPVAVDLGTDPREIAPPVGVLTTTVHSIVIVVTDELIAARLQVRVGLTKGGEPAPVNTTVSNRLVLTYCTHSLYLSGSVRNVASCEIHVPVVAQRDMGDRVLHGKRELP